MARVPAPTADQLRAAFAAGDSVAEVAARFGCSERNVRHLAGLYRVALPRARRRSTVSGRLADVGWLRSMRADGVSTSTIATTLGVRPAEVDEALRAAGLPTGPPPRRHLIADEQLLRSRFAAGGTAATIAAEIGCVPATVNAAARRFGIAHTDPRVQFAKLQDPVWLAEQLTTRTVREIAAQLGCTQSAVGQAKRRAGLQPQRATLPLLDHRAWLHTQYIVDRRSRADIAAQVGCGTATLERALARYGLRRSSRRGPQPRVSDRRWLLVQRSLGRSAPDLAAEVGLSPTAMRATLRRFGLRPGRHTLERRARLDWERTGSINTVARLNQLSHANARALLIELELLDRP